MIELLIAILVIWFLWSRMKPRQQASESVWERAGTEARKRAGVQLTAEIEPRATAEPEVSERPRAKHASAPVGQVTAAISSGNSLDRSGSGRFCVIDVETANPALHSICQIGLIEFRDGREVAAKGWLVDPDDYFDPGNVAVHGIDAHHVRGAPRFLDVFDELCAFVGSGEVLVSHTAFDRTAIERACDLAGLEVPQLRWLDSAAVARRTWPDVSQRGYGLSNLAGRLGIEFRHHDAVEDARAAGEILLHAIEISGLSPEDWLKRSRQPISGGYPEQVRRVGSGDGPLAGERVVFTGQLGIARKEAADQAAGLGADVHPGVTKHTSLLVVGDQDVQLLAGHEKSAKHRKAEQLIAKGQAIRILTESDWRALVATDAAAEAGRAGRL